MDDYYGVDLSYLDTETSRTHINNFIPDDYVSVDLSGLMGVIGGAINKSNQERETAEFSQNMANIRASTPGDVTVVDSYVGQRATAGAISQKYTSGASLGAFSASIKKIGAEGNVYNQRRRAGEYDCSSGVQRLYKETFGINVGSTTLEQRTKGVKVDRPHYGTLIHLDNKKHGSRHVMLYLGDGKAWHFGLRGAQVVNLQEYLHRNKQFTINSYRDYVGENI